MFGFSYSTPRLDPRLALIRHDDPSIQARPSTPSDPIEQHTATADQSERSHRGLQRQWLEPARRVQDGWSHHSDRSSAIGVLIRLPPTAVRPSNGVSLCLRANGHRSFANTISDIFRARIAHDLRSGPRKISDTIGVYDGTGSAARCLPFDETFPTMSTNDEPRAGRLCAWRLNARDQAIPK